MSVTEAPGPLQNMGQSIAPGASAAGGIGAQPAIRTLYVVFLASIFVQIEILDVSGRSLVLYHVLAALLGAVLAVQWLTGRPLRLRPVLLRAIAFIALAAVPAYAAWPLGFNLVLPAFAVLYFFLGVSFARFDAAERRRIYMAVLWIFLGAVMMRNLIFIDQLNLVYGAGSAARTACWPPAGGTSR